MQIAQQILELRLSKIAPRRRHQVAPVQNHLHNAIVPRRRAAGQIRLAKNSIQTRPVQRLGAVSVVAACACGDKHCLPARFLRSKCGKRFSRRQRFASGNQRDDGKTEEK